MNLSRTFEKLAVPVSLAVAVSMGTPAFAHHMDAIPLAPDAFSCKRDDLAGLNKTQLVKKLLPTSVFVNNPAKGSTGSGVVIDSGKGYIITNNHVADGGGDKLTVNIYDQNGFNNVGDELQVKLVGTDPEADIAVLQVIEPGAPNLPCAPLGDSSKVEILDDTIAIGGPLGLPFTVTKGVVSSHLRRSMQADVSPVQDFIQTDASINPGNSGGPLYNLNGEVIGINTMIFSSTGGSQGLGFAVESNIARFTANSLITSGKVSHGMLGVGIKNITKDKAKELGMDKPHGVLVEGQKNPDGTFISAISPGGAAEKAGVKDGDVILNFGGHELKNSEDLRTLVSRSPANLTTSVTVLRQGKTLDLTVTLGDLTALRAKQAEQQQQQEQQQPGPRRRGGPRGPFNQLPPQMQPPPEQQPMPEGPFGAPQLPKPGF